ncbi:MAG TPA: Uma2 family endonuclease [Gemmatimonadaceae bacterium]
MPATIERYWLPADLEQFPEGNGCKYECIDGELLVTPAPRVVHVAALSHLSNMLNRGLPSSGATPRVVSSTADLCPEPTTVVEPDLFVLRAPITAKTRLDDPACAVLIAEVLSPSTAKRDRGIKRMLYQRVGVPEYWIIDLDARLIERWTPSDTRPEILREQLTWTDPVSGAELVLDVERYFAAVWGEESPAT